MLKPYLFSLIFIFCVLPLLSIAQQRTVIHVEKAKIQKYESSLKDIEKLLGDVVIRQDSTRFYCDSAYLNEKERNFEAFGNVHIKVSDTLNIYSDRLKYHGETRIAELFDNVKMVDDTTILETQYLIYNRITQLAQYPDNGLITSGENKLKSKRGYYQTNKKEFYFSKDVELINPEYTTYTDTMKFNTISQIAWFYGPTLIRGDENTIYCEYGWYDTGKDYAYLTQKTSMTSNEQVIKSDSLFYDRNIGFGNASGHVTISDTTNKFIIKGGVGKIWEDEGHSYVTKMAQVISYDDNDSLYMHADTLFMKFDRNRKAEKITAYYGVRFYKSDLQGKCDSLIYDLSDSTMKMYKLPVIWSDQNQLTSDSIFITTFNNKLDSLVMYSSAFIVSKDSIKGYNQIKGKSMVGYFKDNQLDRIFVDGNAQTIYWVRQEDKSLIGINLAESSTMLIRLVDNEIQGISYFSSPKEVMYPEKELPEDRSKLKGFIWLNEYRPINRRIFSAK